MRSNEEIVLQTNLQKFNARPVKHKEKQLCAAGRHGNHVCLDSSITYKERWLGVCISACMQEKSAIQEYDTVKLT